MLTGTITHLGNGFGIVTYEENSQPKEAFFHVSTLQGVNFLKLKVGQQVSFTLSKQGEGLIESLELFREGS